MFKSKLLMIDNGFSAMLLNMTILPKYNICIYLYHLLVIVQLMTTDNITA